MKLGVRFGSILALTLVFLTGRVHAAPSDPVIIFETPGVGVTQYSVLNQSTNSAQPFAVTAFLVTTTSLDPAPATTNADWTAQKLTFIDWGLTPMGGTGSGLPTWEQYTGLSFVQVTGDSHVTVNGYFNNYTYDSGSGLVSLPSDPIKPGDPIRSGFSFTGSPNFDVSGGRPGGRHATVSVGCGAELRRRGDGPGARHGDVDSAGTGRGALPVAAVVAGLRPGTKDLKA